MTGFCDQCGMPLPFVDPSPPRDEEVRCPRPNCAGTVYLGPAGDTRIEVSGHNADEVQAVLRQLTADAAARAQAPVPPGAPAKPSASANAAVNQLGGTVQGNAVQAGSINIHYHLEPEDNPVAPNPAHPPSSVAPTPRRSWADRLRRITRNR